MGTNKLTPGLLGKVLIEIFQEHRENRNEAYAKLASRVPNMTEWRVFKTLTGKAPMMVDEFYSLCEAYDLSIPEVLEEAERRLSPAPSPASSNLVEFPTPPQPTPEQLAKMAAKRDPLGEEIYEDT